MPSTKASRRVTKDDFEELLQSGATRQLANPGRRIDELGVTPKRTRTRQSSTESDGSTTTTTSPSASPMASPGKLHPGLYEPASRELEYPSSSVETKRRSVYRSVGTASSPDLATLVRTTKERRAAEAAQHGDDEDGQTLEVPFNSAAPPSTPVDATVVQPELRSAAPLSPIAGSPTTSLTPPLSAVSPSMLYTPQQQRTPGSLHVPSPSNSRPRAISGTPSSTISRESNGRDSFIHVARDTPSAADWASPPLASTASPPLGSRRGITPVPLGVQDEMAHQNYYQASKPLFSNTMRKTSGFFKKKIASMGSSSRSHGERSMPNTPVVGSFEPASPPPPVPNVPSDYASTSRRSDANRPRRPSAAVEPRVRETRMSQDARLAAAPPPLAGSSVGRSSGAPDRPPMHGKLTPSSTWSMDWDGIMANIPATEEARPSPTPARRAESAPTTPLHPPIPMGTPYGMTQSARGKEKQPLPEPPSPTSLRHSPRLTSLATAADPDPVTPTKASRMPANGPLRSGSEPDSIASDTPSIRLPHSSSSPAPPPKDALSPRGSEDTSSEANNGVGLGLGLETIRESSHSREASANSRHTTTPEARPSLPQLITQSPSPAPLARPATAAGTGASLLPHMTTPTKRAAARHSVVGYPTANGSSISLQRGQSRGSERSGEEASLSSANAEERAVELAQRIWDEDDTFLRREKVAEWLGGHGRLNKLAVKAYFANFDFSGLRLDLAFRKLCEKLYLKAETQQVDRILVEFSARYWANNPHLLYGSADVVHIVTYTLLLLNTDLHVVESNSRMSRNQFIRNAMSGIQASASSSAASDVTSTAPSAMPTGATEDDEPEKETLGRASMDRVRDAFTPRSRSKRSNSIASQHSLKQRDMLLVSAANLASPNPSAASSPSVSPVKSRKNSFIPGDHPPVMSRQWQVEMEALLKDMYNAIRDRPVFQPMAASSMLNLPESGGNDSHQSLSPSSPYNSWAASRAGSRRSQISIATAGASSDRSKRTSILGGIGRSASPTPSMATSFSEGHSGGTTATTAYGSSLFSPNSAASTATTGMGFASNLSHTIIRESQAEDESSSLSGASVSDEELALLGAPWAKEGILQRKHYWESPHRRSKDKEWLGVFVVIQRGELKMFKFGQSSRSMVVGGGIGGGNWMNNASLVGELTLTHALCTAMPAPGYNKSRPHVFVLTLHTGSSYFFEAGTADLVNEWVSTCNYWSARLSKEPLTGGVSNMEYGWNRVVLPGDERHRSSYDATGDDEDDDADEHEELASLRSGKSGRSRASRTSRASMHSAFAGRSVHASSSSHHGTGAHSSNPNDRIFINEWRAPAPTKMPSTLPEEQQLDALRRYLRHLGRELERHGELRKPMNGLYSSRSNNLRKAQDNWARKQQHLTEETVKFSTYIDALAVAIRAKQTRLAERTVADMLETADEAQDELGDAGELADLSPTTLHGGHYANDATAERDEEADDDHPSDLAPSSAKPHARHSITSGHTVMSMQTDGSDIFVDAPAPQSEVSSPL